MGFKFKKVAKVSLAAIVLVAGYNGLALAAGDPGGISLLAIGSFISAVLGLIGVAIAGWGAGKSYDSYTGYERYFHGVGQFFNRKPFEKDVPTYETTERHQRLSWVENIFNRRQAIFKALTPPEPGPPLPQPPNGVDSVDEPFRTFYKENPQNYKHALKLVELAGKQLQRWPEFADRYAIIDAYSAAHGSPFDEPDIHNEFPQERLFPQEPQGPPEESDYRGIRRDTPLPFRSPQHASDLIKRITHAFGATLVGITELNPDWCYQGVLRGVGETQWEKPDHWKYAIVFASPHEWDQMYVNPTYGTSFDAYARERDIAGKLETFIKELGYPARSHTPPFMYDVVTPPIAIDAGLGEVARNGICMTPELGCNARLAVVTTDIPMAVDKPIDIGIREFCKKCKICADACPSGAISHKDDVEEVRGYKRWVINDELCFHSWASVATSKLPRGCRVCIAVCPYTRKNNWIHAAARYFDPRDPTGLVSSGLLRMQKSFFKYPKAKDYLPPPTGKNATFHEPPDWLLSEKWFDIKKNW
jgi:epoxyqueuosine reductase